MSILLPFESLNNTRDLGGMKTKDGKIIRPGKLIRSGHLSELTKLDQEKLGKMLSVIIDLRTDNERKEKPDDSFPGVQSFVFPVMESMSAGITRDEASIQEVFSSLLLKPTEAKEYMTSMYRNFANSESAAEAYSQFLNVLLSEHDKAVLWHCTAGKDRAGIASVLTEWILGISKEDIVADYYASSKYLKEDVLFLTEYVKHMAGIDDPVADESLEYLFGAEEDYIMAYFNAVEESYGSMESYLKKALSWDEEMSKKLRAMYLQ